MVLCVCVKYSAWAYYTISFPQAHLGPPPPPPLPEYTGFAHKKGGRVGVGGEGGRLQTKEERWIMNIQSLRSWHDIFFSKPPPPNPLERKPCGIVIFPCYPYYYTTTALPPPNTPAQCPGGKGEEDSPGDFTTGSHNIHSNIQAWEFALWWEFAHSLVFQFRFLTKKSESLICSFLKSESLFK